jgi:long-chain acyl-CoA synthetase
MIAHDGLLKNIASCYLGQSFTMTEEDVHMSYLPLPHVFERMFILFIISKGATTVFYRGDKLKIMEDLRIVKPTFWITVPKILNTLHDALRAGLHAVPEAKAALEKKMAIVRQGRYEDAALDPVFFKNTRAALGGRVRYVVTGSAPVAGEVLQLLKAVLCCPVIEGYGQTESYAASFITWASDCESGHVGGVTMANEFKVVDVPDLNYLSTDKDSEGRATPRGEVCIRGAVIPGYFRD